MKPVAADVGDFAALREGGFVYVDKTAFLRRLVTSPETRLCIVSRPGGFGKSLALSAVKAAFSGRRELFEGLAFSQSPWAWTSLPVIDLRLGGVAGNAVFADDEKRPGHADGCEI